MADGVSEGRESVRTAAASKRCSPFFDLLTALVALGVLVVTGCVDSRAADREAGRRLLAQYRCGSCHRIPGVEAAIGDVAVPLEHFGQRSYIAGRVPNTPDHLVRWLVRPDALVPGTTMPDLGVSEQDARRMAAYLGALE
jgi:cytochrome c2